MAIPETIKKLANDIRTKIYGREVREALAQGIEEAGSIADQANQTSNAAVEQVRNIQAQVDQLVVEGDSSVEAAQARVDADGNVFTTLKERLDTKETQFANEIGILNRKISFVIDEEKIDGLNLTFQHGTFYDSSGNKIEINNTNDTVTLLDNETQYIHFDLFLKKLIPLKKNVHSGSIVLAKVTTTNGSITSFENIPFEIPKSPVEKTKRKLKHSNNPVKIALIGDSLTEGAGTGTKWFDLLFNSAYSSEGFNLSRLSNVTVDNYGVGGQTSHYGFALLGEVVYCSTNASFANTSIKYKKNYGIRYKFNKPYLKSPLLGGYDLAIIGFGVNGGTYNLPYLENIVRELRNVGTEVIILTQNPYVDNLSKFEENIQTLKEIATVHSCALADTWSYVWLSAKLGESPFADFVHMAENGHKAYAKAIRSVLNDYDLEYIDTFDYAKGRILKDLNNKDHASKFENACELVFEPDAFTGTYIDQTQTDTLKNPALLIGGKSKQGTLMLLDVNQYATFSHPHAIGMDLLISSERVFTAEIRNNNGANLMRTISGGINGVYRTELVEAVPWSYYGTHGSLGALLNQGVQVKVTSGSMKLIGVVFYTFKNNEVNFEKMYFKGTWGEDSWEYGHPYSKYTDTIGDFVIIPFKGNGIQVLVNNKSAGGIVNVYLDGSLVLSNYDLYGGGLTLKPINVFTDSTNLSNGYGDHELKIELVGVNASAIAPTSKNHRLQILNAYEFDAR